MSQETAKPEHIEWHLHPPYGAQLRPTIEGGITLRIHHTKIDETLQWFKEAVEHLDNLVSGKITPANAAYWEFRAKVALGLAKPEDAPELVLPAHKESSKTELEIALGQSKRATQQHLSATAIKEEAASRPSVTSSNKQAAVIGTPGKRIVQLPVPVSTVPPPPTTPVANPTFANNIPVGIPTIDTAGPTVETEAAESTLPTDVSSLLNPPPTTVHKVIEQE